VLHGAENWGGGCCAPLCGASSPSNTMWPGSRPYLRTKWHLDASSRFATIDISVSVCLSVYLSVCLSVCLLTYLKNHVFDNAIHYVVPVLWMTSCFQTRRQLVPNTDRVDLSVPNSTKSMQSCDVGPKTLNLTVFPARFLMKFYGLRTFHDDVIFLIWLPFNGVVTMVGAFFTKFAGDPGPEAILRIRESCIIQLATVTC